ncbi:MAG: asparagine synthase (glutamine-hydrolyzing) [Acidobacteria bacterium]|nr:asparagine synthase (glutamine-hydrolyzing) [Acidobacteriota bacterium]
MSGIAGICNLDGRPADGAPLRRMTGVIAHRGPDGAGHWVNGPVGLGHRMLHTTPESLLEQQPLTDENGVLCLTLDGRVDNREELRQALEAKGARVRSDTDAELVLRAYEIWGEQCPEKILGDFAFAIWDGRKQQLFCARDILGLKPFYYYAGEHQFVFGSEPRQLFEDASVPRQPNEGMVGEYLAFAVREREETLFKNVLCLLPAHYLVVEAGKIRKVCYWDGNLTRQVRYRTDAEYVEHFLELFAEAVRCRLRSHGPVGAHLSGGVDSSSVVGMVESLLSKGVVADCGFETFSLVFPGLDCDESRYIQDVVARWGLRSNLAHWHKEDSSAPIVEEVRRCWDFPTQPNGIMHDSLQAIARQKGFRVLLSGIGGDEWLAGSFLHYADLLRHLRIPSLLSQARFDARIPAVYLPALPILRTGLWPLLPGPARRVIRSLLGRQDSLPSYVNRHFASGIQLQARIRKDEGPTQFSSYAQRSIYLSNNSGWMSYRYHMIEQRDSRFEIERRDPFNDRRIAEFALALPEEQRWRKDWTKFLLRQSMKGLVPDSVLARRDKPDFSIVFAEALQALGGGRLFDSLQIASLGWVDGERVRELYRQTINAYQGSDPEEVDRVNRLNYVNQLWMVWGIELWFQTVFVNSKPLPAKQFCEELQPA